MKIYKKAILPSGFLSNAVACGIKKKNRLDLALFYSQVPAKAACRFTDNKIQAAPVKIDKIHLKHNRKFKAVIANSGNANAFTGKQGLKAAQGTADCLAGSLRINKQQVLIASTGIIGRQLPLRMINKAIPDLVSGLTRYGIDKAKRAIMTTDTFAKEITVRFYIANKPVTICGVAKGAGMIAPDLATMLCFILTDANISAPALNRVLGACVENSFNCITVDGCMSTNDSVILLANGEAKNTLIESGKNFNIFLKSLNLVCLELAKMIVRDAEGATKFISVKITGAKNFIEAKKAALSIANSNLFKTAIYGQNPNFGRIVSAVGASGIEVKEEGLKMRAGSLNKKEVNIEVKVGSGNAGATVYTSDLTPEYIKINAAYN